MKTELKYFIEMPSDIDNMRRAVKDITGYIRSSCENLDSDCMFELKVILNELLLNAVKHGNKGDPGKSVRVTCGIASEEYIYLMVEDQGSGHDCKCLPCRNDNAADEKEVCEMKETGRGIMIVRNLCSKMKFNNRGNKVVILKTISKNH